MVHNQYQKKFDTVIGKTCADLCGVGTGRGSPQEITAKSKLRVMVDRAFKNGSDDPDASCAEITDEFERVLSAIGLPDDKAKLVLDTLYDELGTQFCGEGGNR